MNEDEFTQEWETLEHIFDEIDNIEMLPENLLQLAEQAKKLACLLDPTRTKEIIESNNMNEFIEPHFTGIIGASGNLYIGQKRYGTECYVYFGKKVK